MGESDDDDPDENSHVSIKQRYRRELERAERENRENTSAVLELRDMEDELTTLFKVFDSQEATLRTMRVIYAGDDLKDFTHNGQAYLDAALMRLEGYKQNTNEMLRRVETTRKDVSLHGSMKTMLEQQPLMGRNSTRNCSRWLSDKPRSTTCGGLVSRRSSRQARTSAS